MGDLMGTLLARVVVHMLGTLFSMFVNFFVVLFKHPKIMVPILVFSGAAVFFFGQIGMYIAFILCMSSFATLHNNGRGFF